MVRLDWLAYLHYTISESTFIELGHMYQKLEKVPGSQNTSHDSDWGMERE